ncbi:hypothetical protein Glove_41g118 [Diversispora epigaea]|uniref:MPN domain-containing protein n=1 Tax=Diversispora epigaea TaxID=1348612 RepID=A0A397JHF8_9GLOM|nr:hypothetical protein Glove_41g118 [Diversispora epigaea]
MKFIPGCALKIYFRSANSLLQQANRYKEESDLVNAYRFYMRYATLALEKLPNHPDYKKVEHKNAKSELFKNTKVVLNEMSELKPILNDHFRKISEAALAEAAAQKRMNSQVNQVSPPKPSTPTQKTEWNLAEQLKGLPFHHQTSSGAVVIEEPPPITQVQYPGISMRNQSDGYIYSVREVPSITSMPPPAIPPKIKFEPPQLPPKPYEYNHILHTQYDKEIEPSPDFAAYTEGGEGLRKVCLPNNINEMFTGIASGNTSKNLETCGILFGTLTRNVFYVTTLIIPKQTATSDTCTMTNEEELIEYQELHGLMMLGWIHTHPSQTCFMSSMDLHTHSSYQVISPEAIAIVCSPKHNPNFGIFRLTNPPGLQTVLQCTERGFHPHDSDSLIEKEISFQGHVEMKQMNLEVVDLR